MVLARVGRHIRAFGGGKIRDLLSDRRQSAGEGGGRRREEEEIEDGGPDESDFRSATMHVSARADSYVWL